MPGIISGGTHNVGRYIVFRRGEQSYAFPIEYVEVIHPLAEASRVPIESVENW